MPRHVLNPVVALALASAGAGLWAAPAAAAHPHARTMPLVCAARTTVMNTPRGLTVGFLTRGTPIVVMRRTGNHYWSDIRAAHSIFGWIAGWIHTGDIC